MPLWIEQRYFTFIFDVIHMCINGVQPQGFFCCVTTVLREAVKLCILFHIIHVMWHLWTKGNQKGGFLHIKVLKHEIGALKTDVIRLTYMWLNRLYFPAVG